MQIGELTRNWQALLAAAAGIGLGSAINHYTMSLFGPPLIAEFGWSKSQFALLGSIPVVSLFAAPFAGRFTDRYGARIAATIGFVAVPLGFLAFAAMQGSITQFFAIWIVQHIFGILTTSLVFCRVIVEKFDAARGIALSLLMTTPPLIGAIAAPTLGALIETEGWRAGYVALAIASAVGGGIAIALMGRGAPHEPVPRAALRLGRGELRRLLCHPTFVLIVGGMVLVNVPQVFAASQLKLILMENGASGTTATWMMSLYAVGVIVGRFASGIALDRIQPHLVAIAALGLPAIGYLMIFAGVVATAPLILAIGLIGLAQGAESDVGAYIISRRFDVRNFSLLLSFVTASIGIGSALGSSVLSVSLQLGQGYAPFLMASAVATLLGAALFGLTGTSRARDGTPDDPLTKAVVEQGITGELG